jgi:hypothetical protein
MINALSQTIVASIITSIVTSLIVGMVLFKWQKWVTKKDRCLSNALAARQMYNAIMLSGKGEKSDYHIDAIASLCEFVALAHKGKEVEEEEYNIWLKTLRYYTKIQHTNIEGKTKTFDSVIEEKYYSTAFQKMLDEAKDQAKTN